MKRERWNRKTLAEKFAAIWLYGLFTALLAGVGGFLLVMVSIVEWKMPWSVDLWFNTALVVIAITWWAASQ